MSNGGRGGGRGGRGRGGGRGNRPANSNTVNPFGPDGRRMKCFRCGSTNISPEIAQKRKLVLNCTLRRYIM